MFMFALLVAFWVSLFIGGTLLWPAIIYLVGALRNAIILRVPITEWTDVVAWTVTVLLWPITHAIAVVIILRREA